RGGPAKPRRRHSLPVAAGRPCRIRRRRPLRHRKPVYQRRGHQARRRHPHAAQMSFASQAERTLATLAQTPGWARIQALRPDCDDAVVATMLDAAAGFAETVLAPLNAVGDRVGARVVDGRVRLPPGFAEGFRQYAEAGWLGI